MTMGNKTIRQIAWMHGPLVYVALMLHSVAGCSIPFERSALLKDNYPSIDRVQGPNERSLRNFFKKKEEEDRVANNSLSGKSLKPLPGTDEYLAATPLDRPPAFWPEELGFQGFADLQDVLLHVMTETACHAGHLDSARELIDGRLWKVAG